MPGCGATASSPSRLHIWRVSSLLFEPTVTSSHATQPPHMAYNHITCHTTTTHGIQPHHMHINLVRMSEMGAHAKSELLLPENPIICLAYHMPHDHITCHSTTPCVNASMSDATHRQPCCCARIVNAV